MLTREDLENPKIVAEKMGHAKQLINDNGIEIKNILEESLLIDAPTCSDELDE